MSKIGYYCLNFNNETRKETMMKKFDSLGLDVEIFHGVEDSDQTVSILKGHHEILQSFYSSDNDYAIIFEDDLKISKNFNEQLPTIIHDFKEMKLDIMLLGYLINYHPFDSMKIKKSYYKYNDHLWGTQTYLISKEYCRWFLFDYSLSFNCGLGIDSLITKFGNRAMVYPPLTIENGLTWYISTDQHMFHKSCFNFCNNDTYF